MQNIHNLLLAILCFTFTSSSFAKSIDTRVISSEPKEIYGYSKENVQIRIGNGGGGATGILRALAEDYLQSLQKNYSISWYQDISINTLAQLKKGRIDIALIYEKSQGEKAQEEGWATNYTPIFNDHFLIIGPKNNEAKLAKFDSPATAFSKIARLGEKNSVRIFLSRNDNSGTNVKERSIWSALNLKPWEERSAWYFKSSVFPRDALLYSDQHSLYSVTDWGTWLSNKSDLKNSEIYVRGGEILLNPCFALIGKNPSSETLIFLDYLKSERAQKLIAEFGKNSYGGSALFTPASKADF